MPRTAVPVTNLTANAGTADVAGTAADPTNDHVVDCGGASEQIILRCANTNGSPRTVTIKAGANPPAFGAAAGDLVVSVPATTGVRWIGPLESGRFIQADGTLNIDLEASFAGTITAFKVPKTWA